MSELKSTESEQLALRERTKELSCLYGIAQIAALPGLNNVLQAIANLLPSAWLYPEVAVGCIKFDNYTCSTGDYKNTLNKISADIIINNAKRGVVEIIYTAERPEMDEGPFLKEERSLIDTVAKEVSIIIERMLVEEDKIKLQEQVRHSDRLATIGQLSAGVAHELNEPLSNILGFAQLVRKIPGLPKAAEHDIDKIINYSLHARETVKKLLMFSRQMPTKKAWISVNQVVQDGLYFLKSRCEKEGIELIRLLDTELPEIYADQSQLHQVLVNLVVNAIQAMPNGGKITIKTLVSGDHIILIVEDTGIGMSKEIMKKIFIPFFTTKEVGQGTGLGLSLAHGIITAHGGVINVESKVNAGSRFEVKLPIKAPPEPEENE
ncbi:MAG: ATP-binding protein [Candidatus Paceibacterota bacterium]